MVRRLRNRLPLWVRGRLRAYGGLLFFSDLDRLARWYGTDKSSSGHGYTPHYARHLHGRRFDRLTILEIGVGGHGTDSGGPSLRMWRSYFIRSNILGIDLHRKDLPTEKRISIVQGDQSDSTFLRNFAVSWGPFDLIVDDGSHRGDHIGLTFFALWDYLRPGGFYVIEDLETAYDPAYGGGAPGTPVTSMSLLKELLDGVQGHGTPAAAVHVYPGIGFIGR